MGIWRKRRGNIIFEDWFSRIRKKQGCHAYVCSILTLRVWWCNIPQKKIEEGGKEEVRLFFTFKHKIRLLIVRWTGLTTSAPRGLGLIPGLGKITPSRGQLSLCVHSTFKPHLEPKAHTVRESLMKALQAFSRGFCALLWKQRKQCDNNENLLKSINKE